jgi:hypothetical protein
MTRDTQLLRLAVRCVLAAARAVFLQFHPTGIVAPIFLGRVIAFFALSARQGDYRANIFLRGHTNLLAAVMRRSFLLQPNPGSW